DRRTRLPTAAREVRWAIGLERGRRDPTESERGGRSETEASSLARWPDISSERWDRPDSEGGGRSETEASSLARGADIGEGSSLARRPDSSSSSVVPTSGSELTPTGCSWTRISPEYDVRRHSVPTSRSNPRAASSSSVPPGIAGAVYYTFDTSGEWPP